MAKYSKGKQLAKLVNSKTREIIVKDFSPTLNIKSVGVMNIVQNAPDMATNQSMGGIDLKNLCKMYNLNSRVVFKYCEAEGYFARDNYNRKYIPLETIDRWVKLEGNKKGRKNKTLGTDANILLMVKYGTLWVNTNSNYFDKFCRELAKNCVEGYNTKVKSSDFKLNHKQKRELKAHKDNK